MSNKVGGKLINRSQKGWEECSSCHGLTANKNKVCITCMGGRKQRAPIEPQQDSRVIEIREPRICRVMLHTVQRCGGGIRRTSTVDQ